MNFPPTDFLVQSDWRVTRTIEATKCNLSSIIDQQATNESTLRCHQASKQVIVHYWCDVLVDDFLSPEARPRNHIHAIIAATCQRVAFLYYWPGACVRLIISAQISIIWSLSSQFGKDFYPTAAIYRSKE